MNIFKKIWNKIYKKPSNPSNSPSELNIWATMYYIPKMTSDGKGYDLLDRKGKKLGPKLSKDKFCKLAMEGTGEIDGVIYGYAGKSSKKQVDCKYKASGYARFKKDTNKYGTGVRNYPLIPFKSIAVDKKLIPYGSKVYIAKAKGCVYYFEGEKIIHDGIFYAHDTGGLIKGNHIDVFLGTVNNGYKGASKINPFPFIKSTPKKTYKAIIYPPE